MDGIRVQQGRPGQVVVMVPAGIEAGCLHKSLQGVLFRVDAGRTETLSNALARRVAACRAEKKIPAGIDEIMAALALPDGLSSGAVIGQPGARKQATRRGAHGGRSVARPQWWVRLSGLSGLGHRFPFEVAAMIIDLNADNLAQYRPAKQHRHPPLVWALPPIIAEEHLSWYQRAIGQLRQMGAERFQLSHVVQSALFAEDRCSATGTRLELYGDYSCNLLNSPALHEAASLAMAGVQFSVETDRDTLAAALSSYTAASGRQLGGERLQIGLLLHGRPPLFTARLDAPHFQGHRTLVSSRDERFYLDRRSDALYVRSHTVFSLLPYVSDLARIGLDYYVVDLSHGPLKRECAEVIALLSGRGDRPAVFSGNYSGILA